MIHRTWSYEAWMLPIGMAMVTMLPSSNAMKKPRKLIGEARGPR
jgi:hypothetical protein